MENKEIILQAEIQSLIEMYGEQAVKDAIFSLIKDEFSNKTCAEIFQKYMEDRKEFEKIKEERRI